MTLVEGVAWFVQTGWFKLLFLVALLSLYIMLIPLYSTRAERQMARAALDETSLAARKETRDVRSSRPRS